MYKSFELLNKLYFVRTGGSKEELEAANIIKAECESLGVEAHLESFKVDGCDIKKASVKFLDPDMEIECAGVGMSSSTTEDGITGEFTYVNSQADVEIQDLEGKICLIHSKLVNQKMYRRIVEKKAIGLVLCTGSVYDDAEKVLRAKPKKANIVLIQDELQNDSHNVVATIEGGKYKDEIIAFTAHYDSVSYSKGAYDNATGSTGIMQLLAYFKEHKPARTLKFIWCGSEEMGLLGSKAYVEAHKEELTNYKLCINIDMIGVTIGFDIACCTSNNSLVNYIKYLGCEKGFAIAARQGVYSSDSTPFADAGVPALSFARIAPAGGAVIHSRKDVMDYLEEDNYYKSCDFIAAFSERMVESVVVPVEREIPNNMKEEIEYYFGRKEREF